MPKKNFSDSLNIKTLAPPLYICIYIIHTAKSYISVAHVHIYVVITLYLYIYIYIIIIIYLYLFVHYEGVEDTKKWPSSLGNE
jgi:hypothetical protein